MSNAPKLELRQSQSLVMTAQLQQSIKLLQLSALELSEFVEQELEKNPLLAVEGGEETAVPSDDSGNDTSAESESSEEGDMPEAPLTEGGMEENTDLSMDDNYEEGIAEETEAAGESTAQYTYSRQRTDDGEESNYIDNLASPEISLRDHLRDQLNVDIEDPVQRMIGLHLIDLVDDMGYIKDDLQQLADMLGCPLALVEETLAQLQRFDPPGVCARSLQECLAIQLRERNRLDPVMEKMLANLDLLGRGDREGLRKLCGADREDMDEMLQEIRSLNPKPGSNFSAEVVQTVIPDVFLRKNPKGGWRVELNSEALPRVLINRRYYAELAKQTHTKQERKYLSDQLSNANWLVKALDQRAQTILRVATELVAQQDAFFQHGITHLRPLVLRDIAAALGLHESTVSRVTTSKYMATPRGVYELKYFFTSSVQSMGGREDISSRAVQHMIKELIDAENTESPLSDDTLADMLRAKGIDVARRTVAKYREALDIPSSVQRRRKTASF